MTDTVQGAPIPIHVIFESKSAPKDSLSRRFLDLIWPKLVQTFAVVIVLFVMLTAILSLYANQPQAIIINDIDSPPNLSDRGLSGHVIAARILDDLRNIKPSEEYITSLFQRHERDIAGRLRAASPKSDIINSVQIPKTDISLGMLDSFFRALIVHDVQITGDIVELNDRTFSLEIRGNTLPVSFETKGDDISSVVQSAADYVYLQYRPVSLINYLFFRSQAEVDPKSQARLFDQILALLPLALRKEDILHDKASQSFLVNIWGNILFLKGDALAAAQKHKLAIELYDRNWKAWNNLISDQRTIDEEVAWKTASNLINRALPAPSATVIPHDVSSFFAWKRGFHDLEPATPSPGAARQYAIFPAAWPQSLRASSDCSCIC